MYSIILVGQTEKDLRGAELQDLQKKYGQPGVHFRFLERRPFSADHLHRLRNRAKVKLILVPRTVVATGEPWQFGFEPLVPAPGTDWIAPIQAFHYEKMERTLQDYVHRPRMSAAA